MRDPSAGPRWVLGLLLLGLWLVRALLVPPLPTALLAESTAPTGAGSYALTIERCRVRLRDDVRLAAERTGIVDRVSAVGDTVEVGGVVAQLRDAAIRKALAVAEREAANDVEVRYARKKAEHAELKYTRAMRANREAPGIVPELELRELRLEAEQSLLQIEQAEHQLAISQLRRDEQAEQLRTYRVTAPFAGVVVEVLAHPGEVVREGEPILGLVNTRVLEVHGFVELDRLPLVVVGRPAVVAIELTDDDGRRIRREFPARIAAVGVKVEPLTRKVAFTANVVNEGGLLRDGLVATVSLRPSPSHAPDQAAPLASRSHRR